MTAFLFLLGLLVAFSNGDANGSHVIVPHKGWNIGVTDLSVQGSVVWQYIATKNGETLTDAPFASPEEAVEAGKARIDAL